MTPSRLRPVHIFAAVALMAAQGCLHDPMVVVDGEVDATGAAAQVRFIDVAVEGGTMRTIVTQIDSATGMVSSVLCGAINSSVPCPPLPSGGSTLSASDRQLLFSFTRTRAFRELRAEYPTAGTITDPVPRQLSIIANGRQRIIRFGNTAMPKALGDYVCFLQVLRGALIQCASGLR